MRFWIAVAALGCGGKDVDPSDSASVDLADSAGLDPSDSASVDPTGLPGPDPGSTSPTGVDTGTGTLCAASGGFYSGPVTVQEASVSCGVFPGAAGERVRFYARTEGWTANGWVFSQDTANPVPNWSDTHDLESYQWDACGYQDELEQVLDQGALVGTWATNESTVFTCAAHFEGGVMSYAVGVKDLDGNLADCFSWGHDPWAMIQGTSARINEPGFDLDDCVIGVAAG